MKEQLLEIYKDPSRRTCFFTGEDRVSAAKVLAVDSWDWSPQTSINVEPWYWNTHTLALAFGCKPKLTSEGKEWIEPMITSVNQVYDIEIPDPWSGRTGEILREIERLLEAHPENTLIRLPDIQSPLGVAELMWDQSFYIALITNPDDIHALLEKITEFTIKYISEIKRVLGNRYNPATHPHIWSSPEGYYISDDVNSMISPEQHMEYSINHINRITKVLGPVHYHSCTWTELYFDNIDKLENVKAANWSFGTSDDPAEIIKRFSGKYFLTPHLGLNTHKESGITRLEKDIHSAFDLTKYLLDHMLENTSLYFVFQEDLCKDPQQLKDIFHLMKERGFTPAPNNENQ